MISKAGISSKLGADFQEVPFVKLQGPGIIKMIPFFWGNPTTATTTTTTKYTCTIVFSDFPIIGAFFLGSGNITTPCGRSKINCEM